MEQLSGLDAAFIHQDSHRTPMHVCAVLLYDCGKDSRDALSTQELAQLIQERLCGFALFRQKLKRVAMSVDTPYWVEVAEPEWYRHMRTHNLPPPGDWQTLQRKLEDLHAGKMNLSRPLWECHLVNGLSGIPGFTGEAQAVVFKIHHAAIDGLSLALLINALHQQSSPEDMNKASPATAPAPWELWTRAHVRNINRQFKFAETMGNLLPGVVRARRTRKKFHDLPPVSRNAGHFNARVSAARSIGVALLPMPEVISIKRAVRRVTLNDIALSCVSGALRDYLIYHRRLPEKSLVAGVPINLRTPSGDTEGRNRIATMAVGLGTRIADPVERLRLVHRYAVAGKKQIDALGSGTVMDISDSLPPRILAEGVRSMARASQLALLPVPFHTMVSNVPGPAKPAQLGKAKLIVPLGLGPVRDNMGLFHIVSSSESMMSLTFNACRKLIPDPDFYQQCLQNAFAALLGRASSQVGGADM